jgi:hypothetical protein
MCSSLKTQISTGFKGRILENEIILILNAEALRFRIAFGDEWQL